MKKLTTFTLLIFAFAAAYGQQTGRLSLTVTDAVSKEGIGGAVVELTPAKDTTARKYYITSGAKGAASLPGVPYGSYKMKVTFLGYAPYTQDLSVRSAAVDAGVVALVEEALAIKNVVVEAQAMRTSQKGDTVVYNADAFKVARDADAEGLLSKMPGITVIDGQVEAQGETVKKIFVNGKEFFGSDVNATMKNLPAEIISKVEVYNKLSDQAEFSGVDDGEGYKAINIVTLPNAQVFGKLQAGWGYKDKYIAGGNINYFQGNQRISLIGLTNNINQQNFSTDDILGVNAGGGGWSSRGGGMRMRGGGGGSGRDFMVGQVDGISKVHSIGLNYINKIGEKIDFQGSYLFSANQNDNDRITDSELFGSRAAPFKHKVNDTWSRREEHRVNLRLDYKINEYNTLMIRPAASIQDYRSTVGETVDNLQSLLPRMLLSHTKSDQDSHRYGYNISNALIYRARLGKPGRTITFDLNGRMTKNDRDVNEPSYTAYYDPTLPDPMLPIRDSTINKIVKSYTSGYNLEANAIYTEPLTSISQFVVMYRAGYSNSQSEADTKISDGGEEGYISYPQYSNNYTSTSFLQRVGPGFRMGGKSTNLVANVYFQTTELTGHRTLPAAAEVDRRFNNFSYFGILNQPFNPTNTRRVFLHSHINNPSVDQLQDVVSISDGSTRISMGNPDLTPSQSHSLSINYTKSSVTKGRTFMVSLGGETVQNNIGNLVVQAGKNDTVVYGIPLAAYGQFSKPVNLDGYQTARANMSFGTPVKFLKSNLNFNLGYRFSNMPSILNDAENISKAHFYSGGATLSSNISEKLDFTLNYNGGYNVVKNSINTDGDNTYFSHWASGKFKWVAWAGFTLSGNATYSQYKGISTKYNEEFLICNLMLGKKLFKNQRGELTAGIYDLLDQNKSFSRNVTSTSIENVTDRTMGRYWGVTFTFNLRSYSGAAASKPAEGETPRYGGGGYGGRGEGRGGGGGYGPPPGGGPGGF